MSDYKTGTITLTSGQVSFTTTGSALQAADIREGDAILVKGFYLVIATITGENAGTLEQPCPAGAAGAGQPLRIRFQSAASRNQASVNELIQILEGAQYMTSDGNIIRFERMTQAQYDAIPLPSDTTVYLITS